MYNRAFPVGNALFLFAGGMMSLLRLPCSKLPLAFLAVPAGKDGRVECPCQTVDDFIGVRGSVCGLFLFVQKHAPLTVPPWQSRARKSKFQFHVRRKGADAFRPALAAGDLLMAYRCLLLCGLFFFRGFCKSLFHIGFDFSQVVSRPLHCEAENLLLFRVSEIAGIVFERFLATVYKGNIIKNLIMDCQSYTKYRPNETTGGIFVSWRRKEELPTGA